MCVYVCVCMYLRSCVCGVFLVERLSVCLSPLSLRLPFCLLCACDSVWILPLCGSWFSLSIRVLFACICVLVGLCVCVYSSVTVPVCVRLSTRCLSVCLAGWVSVCLCRCLFGGFGCLPVLAGLSVHRRQEHRAGKRAEPRAWPGGPSSSLSLC